MKHTQCTMAAELYKKVPPRMEETSYKELGMEVSC